MGVVDVVVLALIQALTEFLPISSSGHLALYGFFLDRPYQGLTFDLALHVGTLLAVVVYFRRDLWTIGVDTLKLRRLDDATPLQRLGLGIVVGTLPAALVGALMPDAFTESLRVPSLIAVNLIVFGVLLYAAERFGAATRDVAATSVRDAFLIGCAQALALVPGTSRSGITMTAALALGLSREAAARYSFLMSVPITALATAHGALTFLRGDTALEWNVLLLGIAVSAAGGIAVIHLLLGVVRRVGTLPFVLYRVALGLVVLALI
jgi:undecaprenyl-diphosphatase